MNALKKMMLAIIGGLIIWIAYSNHFHNPFAFDDDHTIVTNLAIRNTANIPSFFYDATTTSSYPASQAYRPGLTALNAIDASWSKDNKDLDPFPFHVSIFISVLVLGWLLYVFLSKLFKPYLTNNDNLFWSAALAVLFCIHVANSQTINYIIARADSFSTLMVLAGFVCYIQFEKARKYHLYMLPVIVGFFVKEPSIMFVPLLMLYKLLFEPHQDQTINPIHPKKWLSVIKSTWLPLIIIVGLYFFSRSMTPASWTSGNTDRWSYLISQPYVIIHYFNNFYLPFNLVVDTDWTFVQTITDDRFLIGIGFIFALVLFAVKTAKNHPLITFGIGWFLLALAPTSSVFPLAEVLNDHRPFFPYIGLLIASGYGIIWLLQKYQSKSVLKPIASIGMLAVIGLHIVGTRQSNEIWSSSESLWKEATIKSPNNGRAWMNYGNCLMERADFVGAENSYIVAERLWPVYPYIKVNLGILHAATNRKVSAEAYFKEALELDPKNPQMYHFYGKFLSDNQRLKESSNILQKGLDLSPNHSEILALKAEVDLKLKNPKAYEELKKTEAETMVENNPTAENYLNLSLQHYNAGEYQKCIDACLKSLELKPDYALAYNNICTAYNQLKNWDKAIEYGEKGLKYDPTNELIKGNLKIAYTNKGK